jgi:hypothetical protein
MTTRVARSLPLDQAYFSSACHDATRSGLLYQLTVPTDRGSSHLPCLFVKECEPPHSMQHEGASGATASDEVKTRAWAAAASMTRRRQTIRP